MDNPLYEDDHNNVVCKNCNKSIKVKNVEIEQTLHGLGKCQPPQGVKKNKKRSAKNGK